MELIEEYTGIRCALSFKQSKEHPDPVMMTLEWYLTPDELCINCACDLDHGTPFIMVRIMSCRIMDRRSVYPTDRGKWRMCIACITLLQGR